jgi:hypothetical protein
MATLALPLTLLWAGCAVRARHHTIIGFGLIEFTVTTNGIERLQRIKLFGIYGGEFVTGHSVPPPD